MEFWVILILIYLLIKDVIWTYKEIQLIDRALPVEQSYKKIELWKQFMSLWRKASKRNVKEVPEKEPEPIVDTGQTDLIEGPESAKHKQGIDPF